MILKTNPITGIYFIFVQCTPMVFLADSERERLNSFPTDIPPDDLVILKNSFSLKGIKGEVQIAPHSSRFIPRSKRGWSVRSNLPFVSWFDFSFKTCEFCMGDQHYTYHFIYKMVSDTQRQILNINKIQTKFIFSAIFSYMFF